MVEFDAFISYSSQDKTTADATCAALESAGIRCWIAPRDVTPGTPWAAAIAKALNTCRVMVLIFSSNANESAQIRREVDRVVSRGIPVVPLRIENIVPTDELEYFMGGVHWLDAWTPPLERHLQELAKAVRGFVELDHRRATGREQRAGPAGEAINDVEAAAPHKAIADTEPAAERKAARDSGEDLGFAGPKQEQWPRVHGGQRAPRFAKEINVSMLLSGVVVAAGLAVTLFMFGNPMQWRRSAPLNATQIFDASVVPLVTESVRISLAEYPKQPDAKALAISADSYGMSVAASSLDIAQREALDACRPRSTTICRIYASGTTVTWSKEWIPLPAPNDLRVEPLDLPLVPAELRDLLGVAPDSRYLGGADHRAFAYTTGGAWFTAGRSSSSEAVRQAVERCGYAYHRQCMIVSVDGFPTVQVPKSRRIAGLFMPATEPDMSEAARQRVTQIYQAREWRAVARGKSGTWYAIAAETSELAAVEAALKSCAQGDAECSLYAIGNFRVSDAN